MERFWAALLVMAAMAAAELPATSGCLEKEQLGLTELRRALPPGQLKALPENTDCCSWDGVDCGGATGRVRNLSFSPVDWKYKDLTKLTRLERLSLAENSLNNIDSLQVFASLKHLKYLNLGGNSLNGTNLEGICEMKSIVELYLNSTTIGSRLPPCIGNLTHLQILDLSNNQITGNIPSTVGNLSHLSFLSLKGNYFSGSFSLHLLANSSRLEWLELSYMHADFLVKTETQSWFPSFQLSRLDLGRSNLNNMSGSVIPTFLLHQSELRYIDLSENKLRDAFPSWLLQNNSKLDFLWMRNNSLTGNFILPNFTHDLTRLSISNNKIGGMLPDNMRMFLPALRCVDFSFNSFTGKLPRTLFGTNDDLFYIDFSNNLLDGEIYLNLTTLPSLSVLDLSNNKFNGSIEELPSSPFNVFDVSNNLISGRLPKSLANCSAIYGLLVSNNSFEGEIPHEICGITTLRHLDLSYNKFSGSIPFCLRTSSISYLYMQKCNLSGVIPEGLFSKPTLLALDLSYNNLTRGIVPNWIYRQHNLRSLILSGLELEGEISTQLCGLENIRLMDLSHNNFNGSIPLCLFKLPFWVAEIQGNLFDVSDFFLGSFYLIPNKRGTLKVEFTTKGRQNRLQGTILKFMTGLDVSSNKLGGRIPPQIGDAEAIHTLNLSNNRLQGSIPDKIVKLRDIESFDLSSNNLSGRIPPEIAKLTFLSVFNVSNNNLSGPIPTGGQFGSFDEQSYRGNKFLCGPALRRLCETSSSPSTTPADEEDNNDETIFERTSFWWSFVAAFVTVVISLVVLVGMETHFSRVWLAMVDSVCSRLVRAFVKMKLLLGIQ